MTVLVIVDGFANRFFQQFIAENPTSAIARTMSGARVDYARGSTSAFPSYTFPNQVSLVTGRWPGGERGHGILGNAWFDRSAEIRGNTPPTAPADVREYDAGTYMHMAPHAAYVYLEPGLVNADMRGPTLYDALGEADKESFVSYHMVTNGADAHAWPLPQDYAFYVGVSGVEGSAQYDRAATDAAVAAIYASAPLGGFDHYTLYLSGLDHAGHSETGTAGFQEYLREHVDPQVERVLDAFETTGQLDRVVWLYAADHGHTDMNPDDWVNLAAPEIRDGVLETLPCGSAPCYTAAYEPQYNAGLAGAPGYDATREDFDLVMLNNGGAGYLYLSNRAASDDERWDRAPDFARDVLPFARGIAQNAATPGAALHGTLDDVLVKDCRFGCRYVVLRPGAEMGGLAPLRVLNPAYTDAVARLTAFVSDRSPDVVLLPNYLKHDGWPAAGHYLNPTGALADNRTWFFDRQIEYSTHGSLYPTDSEPVLQIGTTGDALGFAGTRVVHERAKNVDVTPTIVRLHGGAMDADGRALVE